MIRFRWSFGFVVGLMFSTSAHSVDAIATRCDAPHEEYKTTGTCWYGAMITEKGARVSVRATTQSLDPAQGALGPTSVTIQVRYEDRGNFFEGAPRLYPYISVLKTKFKNQGAPEHTTSGGMYPMDPVGTGVYEASIVTRLDSQTSLAQEFFSGLTLAFSDVYPHSGSAKWDSNTHKNHGFWLR